MASYLPAVLKKKLDDLDKLLEEASGLEQKVAMFRGFLYINVEAKKTVIQYGVKDGRSADELSTYVKKYGGKHASMLLGYLSEVSSSSAAAPEAEPSSKQGKGNKRKKTEEEEEESENESDDSSAQNKGNGKKAKGNGAKGAKMNRTSSDLSSVDFGCSATSSEGNAFNFKISSWNVNGIRALLDKKGLEFLQHEDPDIFCLQETKCTKEKIPNEANVEGYKTYWLSGDSEGYSGVGLYTKVEPISINYGIGEETHDREGRVITAEYEKFILVLAYVPNAGRKLVRLKYRMEWDVAFRNYLLKLKEKKPVVLCGDLNVAHKEIDLANPKTNKKNAGFTQEERDGFTTLLDSGFVDTFRHLHPDLTKSYTFWTYMMNARAKDAIGLFCHFKRSLAESLRKRHKKGHIWK